MSQVLLISGHPDLASSYANRRILEAVAAARPEIALRRLDQLYPGYAVDVEAEQEALLAAEIVVLQFPFYWYSVPAILKNWIDAVLTYGFAYGSGGDKLKGKPLLPSVTVGSPEDCYQTLGYNNFTLEELLRPVKQTALMAQMHYQSPVMTCGMIYVPGVLNTEEGILQRADAHATRLLARIAQIQTEGCDLPLSKKLW
ncbi:MAG: NAD(P)H-dependent oxidoreductase [Pseudomonadota bacterium]